MTRRRVERQSPKWLWLAALAFATATWPEVAGVTDLRDAVLMRQALLNADEIAAAEVLADAVPEPAARELLIACGGVLALRRSRAEWCSGNRQSGA
jgi:hypothetical protein